MMFSDPGLAARTSPGPPLTTPAVAGGGRGAEDGPPASAFRSYCPYLRARLAFPLCPGYSATAMTADTGDTCSNLAAERQRRGWVAVCRLPDGPPIFIGLDEILNRARRSRRSRDVTVDELRTPAAG